MKKIYLAAFIFLIVLNVNSQTKEQKLKAISIIESLSYEEVFLGEKLVASVKINYDDNTKKIEIIETLTDNVNINNIKKTIFYIDDLELSSLSVDMWKMNSGLFAPIVRVNGKGSVIEEINIEENKRKFPYPTSETKYLEKLAIFPGTKNLPKELAQKYIENVKVLLGK